MKLHITNCRLSFANGLWAATSMEEGQTKKFGADFILSDNSVVTEVKPDGTRVKTTMQAAMLAVANDTWKGKGQQMLASLEASKKSFRDGNLKLDKSGNQRDGYEGHWYVTAKNTVRPGTFGPDRAPVTESDGVIYSGCFVNVILDLYGNAAPTKKGVFASLTGVQFCGDGEVFGGGRSAAADEFEAIEEESLV